MAMKKLTKTQLALVNRLAVVSQEVGRLKPPPPGPGVSRDMYKTGLYDSVLSEYRWLKEMLGLADES